jgi:hypothetical protein
VAVILLKDFAMRPSTAAVPLLLFALAACSDDLDGPGEHLVARSTQLVQYASCNELEADLKDMVIHEIWADIERAHQGGWGRDGVDGAEGDASGSPGDGGGRQEGVDYSGTNNQEQGVDEADFVKTDGYHIYTLNGNRLHIMGVPELGKLTAESVTKIEGHPRQMLLDSARNHLVVFSHINTYSLPAGHPLKQLVGYQDSSNGWRWRINELSKVTVLDISNKLAPRLVREVFYEGSYQTARKVESSIRMAGYSLIEPSIMWGWGRLYEDSGRNKDVTKKAVRSFVNSLALADFTPQIYVRMPDGHFETNSLSEGSCRSF